MANLEIVFFVGLLAASVTLNLKSFRNGGSRPS
jgi:hypothetical protein